MGMAKHKEMGRNMGYQEHKMDQTYHSGAKGECQTKPTLGSARKPRGVEKVLAKTLAWVAIECHQNVHLASHPPRLFQQREGAHLEGLQRQMYVMRDAPRRHAPSIF